MTLGKYKKIQNIPQKPGVYFWKKLDTILYIGKATHLKNRTSSYLQKNLIEKRGPLIAKMIEESDSLEWQETDSVLEALLLETHLIKKHQPIYNSKEKDNKSHNYVIITNDYYPRVFVVRGRTLHILERKGIIKKIFGPFPQGKLLIEALNITKKIFPFFGKKKKTNYDKDFYAQIGKLPKSKSDQDHKEYLKNIKYIEQLFLGKKNNIIYQLKKEMNLCSRKLLFEKSARLRNQIYALEHIKDIALLKHDFEINTYQQTFRIEAYDIAHLQGEAMVGSCVVHNGVFFEPQEYRLFNIKNIFHADDTGALAQVLKRRLLHTEWQYPKMIVVDGGIAQKRVIEKILRDFELKIPVFSVVKDKHHKAREILGRQDLIKKYKKQIIAINNESHRFTIEAHKKKRNKNFLSS